MRKLWGGGQVTITRAAAFADSGSNVDSNRVVLQSFLHGNASVAHSVSSVISPRSPWKLEERVRSRSGSIIRATAASTISYTDSHGDPFATLGLSAAASKQEIKQAYRKLALQYHPDVCKGDHCARMFKQVNNAYKVALELGAQEVAESGAEALDGFMGATDDNWDDWEEWMGWEGAGITDYSSHVNPAYSF